MKFTTSESRRKFRMSVSKGMALSLATAMVVGTVGTDVLTVYATENEAVVAATEEVVVSETDVAEDVQTSEETEPAVDATEVTEAETVQPAEDGEDIDSEIEEALEETVEAEELEEEEALDVAAFSLSEASDYTQFVEDELVADLKFGQDVTKDTTYSEENGYGFSKVEYPTEAKGWSGNVYYPREVSVTASDASYVENADGALAIKSKVWTETESTGYGVYTYENTSTFDYDLPAADYKVEVTFVNPTGSAYNAYVEAEDITKVTGIDVAAGGSKTVDFTACLVKGNLNLKFLATSDATAESAATEKTVYVSEVKITRLATNEQREDGKPTIFIASDSTVQSYESYYYPQTGWGQVLAEFFGDGDYEEVTSKTANYSQSKTYEVSNAVVENRAIGGRSSSSFVQEGKLDDLLEDVRPGDYLLIQWGHNDSTYSRPNRYVSSSEFASWMQYYIDGAIQRGATPVLVTPVARYSYTTDSEGKLISYASNFEAYRQVMIQMSKEQGIALVDLTQRSIDVANSFGIDGGKSLWLYTNAGDYVGAYAGGSTDSTHLQWYGAYKFAQCVAAGIVDAGNSSTYTNENNASEDNKEALRRLASLIDLRAATQAPGKVSGLKTGTIGASSAAMSWDSDDESEMYYIYRAEVTSEEAASYVFDENATKYSVSRNAKYTDTGCEAGKTYVYAVRGYNSLGLGEFSDTITVTTKAAGFKFDFNYNNSTTQDGWTGVNQNQMYDSELGYGWIKAPGNGRSRGNNGTVSDDLADMAGDFNLGAGEFAVDLPNGDYEVTIYAADLLSGTSTIKPSYNAEGESFGGISCKQSLGSVTGTVRVTDGQLNIVVGGTNQYINGLTITEILKAPTSLNETEASVSGSTYTALLSFVGIDEAAGYNYYIKGSTDTEFHLERTFDKEKYALGVTEYGAISVKLGENYQYYVTAYTADGTESAPSNIVTVNAQIDTATPAAPQNVICVDPTADTEGIQNSITISWDPAEVENQAYPVLKYIVYRSDKAETDKGFKEFVKVGETTTTSFTDSSEGLATNVHYYYKVCASNAGGAGALSEACETPVTGSLVAGNREVLTDRALTAIKISENTKVYATDGSELTEGVYLSWRAFEEEFDAKNQLTTTFDVYVDGTKVASNLSTTNVVLTDVSEDATFTVVGSKDASINGGLKVIETKAWDNQYMEMSLYKPADQTMPDGSVCNYTANDMSVGDVDGDGQLELIVKWYPSNAKDNSGSGYTGTTILDTYDINWNTGAVKLLSRIDLGVNIRSGAHYTQFQVWDYDGDGKAEIAVKTADGSTIYRSVDGTDKGLEEVAFVGKCNAASLPTDVVSAENDYRNSSGYVLSGPEYFTMFNPEDGTVLDTVDYTPNRGTVSKWGDAYGNRVDRFLAGTAYLDGEHPFAVMCRGYYTRTALTAYGVKDTDGDGIGDKIYQLWAYDTDNGDGPEGQGNHNLVIADVDNDGKDEIVYGSSCYDHDGTLKYSTDMGHGDAMHVSDWVEWNDGLEVMEVHEEWNQKYQVEIHDAETGEVLIGYPVSNTDVGRGVASDIDPTSQGAEFWASNAADGSGSGEWDSVDAAVYGTQKSSTSNYDVLSAGVTPSVNATLYWDGDLLAEIQDHVFNNKNGNYFPVSTYIAKWNYLATETAGAQEKILDTDEVFTSNGTKGNLGLIADLTGDWRDEFIARCSADDSKIRLYTTNYVTDYVIPCALDDLQYREGVAWENTGYNQPTHSSYMVSKGLVTAQLSEGTVTNNSVEVLFTPANDGDLYGHAVTGYEIYRNGELIDTLKVSELGTSAGSSTEEEEVAPVEPVAPVKNEYHFDFGDGEVAEGYTQVTKDSLYAEEVGYGFTEINTAGNGTYSGVENEALHGDNVTFYDKTTDHKEFVVDLPNGTYNVTYTIGGNNYYNAITAEGESIETNKFRAGAAGALSTVDAVVTVEDGQLNLVATLSKSNYFNIIFTAIDIVESDEEFAAREAEYEAQKAVYDAYVASKFEEEAETEVDPTYGVKATEKHFDFGAGEVAEGYTQVTKDSLYAEEVGYGFTEINTAGNGTYSGVENEALHGDNVTFYDKTTDHKEFVVDLPNGTYNVTYTIGGNNYYNAITAEGESIETNKFRAGAAGALSTVDAVVTVEDGQLNLVATLSKSNYFNIIFTAIDIVETESSVNAKIEAAKEAYEKEQAENAVVSGDAKYSYVDKDLDANTTYEYQVAAVVDGKTSFMSRKVAITTNISIATVADFELTPVVAGTKVSESVAELLPTEVTVVDQDGKELSAPITWDVSAVDINTVGEYEVVGTVKGYSEPIVKTLSIVANEVKGIAECSSVNVIVGSASVELPKTVSVEYTNGNQDEVAVTWDITALDLNTEGEYTLTGTIEGFDQKATVVVRVVGDYPTAINTTAIEVAVGDSIVKNLPATVAATMASGKTSEVAVTWKTEGVDTIDTSVAGTHMIHGTVEGFDGDILCEVTVAYKALYKFDLGISNSVVADGWTTVTVNAKGGKKTAADLSVEYTAERGYGILDPNAVVEGRTESVAGIGLYPTNVVTDFALLTGQTFVVDVPNGDYLVQVMTNCGIGSTSATVDVEGTTQSFSANKSFTVKDYTVTVEDGQLTITDKSSLARIGAIVVRQMKPVDQPEVEEPETEETETQEPETEETQEPEIEVPATEIQTAVGTWVSGNYKESSKVSVSANEARIILEEGLVASGIVEAGESYKVVISNTSFRMYVRAIKDGKVTSLYFTNGAEFTVEEGTEYYVGLYTVDSKYKNVNFEQYVELFKDGMTVSFEKLAKVEIPEGTTFAGQSIEWVSGNYGMSKATISANGSRMSLAEKFSVAEDQTFKAVVTDGFRIIVRETDKDSLKVTNTLYLVNGTEFMASADKDYYITVYATSGTYKNIDFAQYMEMIAEGTLVIDLQ